MNVPILHMMVGLPASGKSRFAKEMTDCFGGVIYSSDKIREELSGNINNQDINNEVFNILHKRVKKNLQKGINIFYDATNINYKRRMSFLKELKNINCYKECIIMATPYEECLKQNAERERSIPEDVITRMYKNFYIPQMYEGFNSIKMVWNYDKTDKNKFDLHELFNGEKGLNKIDQENPHHTLTIGKHCLMCDAKLEELNPDSSLELSTSALLHDIGKRFCKEFNDGKGYCTYYQHHLVSAYDSLFYTKSMNFDDEEILKIANYIQWHMQPFFIDSDKARDKFIRLVGQEFYDDLMLLHEADIEAK